ncbi:SPRY domain-containing protein [Azospirillum sp.]|uniref:SPRY domain-containing protein n=1 Tax=Azospirillum sp. TaxID=34012 RepID=UPI002624FC9E|nr:SPRY domain-containing protein [Azospirillum sp.]
MTVTTTNVRSGPYAGDGASTAFSVTFEFYAASDLVVIERTTSTGADAVKTLTTHYTVSGGAGGTGTVTAVTAPPSGVSWTIVRQTARTQTTAFVDADSLPAKALEDGFDRAALLAQEAADRGIRSIRIPDSDNTGTATVLPASMARANKALVFDAVGNVGVSTDSYVDQAVASAGSALSAGISAESAARDAAAAHTDRLAAGAHAMNTAADRVAVAADKAAAEGSATDAAASAVLAGQVAAAAGGAAPAARLAWDAATAASDPGMGKVRVNSAIVAGITATYVSENDAAGTNLASVFAAWVASTNAIKGRLRIAHRLNLTVWIEADVTAASDNGSWWTMTLSNPTGPGGFAAGDVVAVSVSRAGDAGANGAGARWGGTSSGSANAQTLTPSPALLGLTGNPSFEFVAGVTNTGAMSLNVSGTGAVSLRKADGAALTGGEVVAGTKYVATHDGTYWRLATSASVGPFSDLVSVTGPVSVTTAAHLGRMLVCTGAAPYTLTLPPPASFGKGAFGVHNRTASIITLFPSSGAINGVSTVTVGAGQSSTVTSDGSSYDAAGQGVTASSLTWNPGDKASAIALSNGNLTATGSASGAGSVRTLTGVSSGKYYWEYVIVNADQEYIGVMRATAGIGQYPGYDQDGYGWWQYNGNKFNNNTGLGIAYGSTWTNGNILAVYLDMDAGKLFFAKNNIIQGGGDPIVGTNPAFSGLSGTIFPAFGDGASASAPVATVRFSAAFWTYTPLVGFGQLP